MDVSDIITTVVERVEEQLKSISSIDSLSSYLGYSKTYLNRLFSKVVGISVLDYIKLRKITEAILGFQSHRDNIVDIAFEYGFNSHEVFIRNCKKYFKNSPGVLLHIRDWTGYPALSSEQIWALTNRGEISEKLVKLPDLILKESKTGSVTIIGSGFRGNPSKLEWNPEYTFKLIPKGIYISFRSERDQKMLIQYIKSKYPYCKTIISVNSIYYIRHS